MAMALATIHWARVKTSETQLWVLDLSQVWDIRVDEDGVAAAVDAYRLNDPYYLRPSRNKLWEVFATTHRATAESMLGPSELPGLFLDGALEIERSRQTRQGAGPGVLDA